MKWSFTKRSFTKRSFTKRPLTERISEWLSEAAVFGSALVLLVLALAAFLVVVLAMVAFWPAVLGASVVAVLWALRLMKVIP